MKNDLIYIEEIRMAARVMRAVNHTLRRDILYLLKRKKKLTVSDICEALCIGQSLCSQHLAILRSQGIVEVERAAKHRYYYIIHSRLQEINDYAKALVAKL